MDTHTMADIVCRTEIGADASPESLWDEGYKIPWDDPDFSRRMLDNHLTQSHDLASRRQETIAAQVRRIHAFVLRGVSSRILDLGCGPGLYSPLFAELGHTYRGMDFGPASIEHARRAFGGSERCSFVLGDVRDAEFGGPYDLAMMLYGELNVFSPDMCRRILAKVHDALGTGGRAVFEVQTYDAVRTAGRAFDTWAAEESGLFSERPHLCLIENHWFEQSAVAGQYFRVIDAETAEVANYRSTTKAWTAAELYDLLAEAGFTSIMTDEKWPNPAGGTMLIIGEKA